MLNQVLINLYGTDDVNSIIDVKSTKKQERAFSRGQPKKVALTAEECKKLCKVAGVEYLDGYESRVVEHIISDETVDRYGDIMRANGVELKNFQKNPVILFVHDSENFPVGKSLKVWIQGKSVRSWGLFFDDRVDPTRRSDVTFKFVVSGGMPGSSIGFLPILAKRPASKEDREKLGLGEWGVEYQKWELLEYSICPVPANPNALQNVFKSFSRDECKVMSDILPKEFFSEVKVEDFAIEDCLTQVVTTLETTEGGLQESIVNLNKTMESLHGEITKLVGVLKPLHDLNSVDVDIPNTLGTAHISDDPNNQEGLYNVFEEGVNLEG